MKKFILAMIAVFILVGFSGCADHYTTIKVDGIITEKDYDAPSSKKVKHTSGSGATKKTYYTTEYKSADWDITVEYKKEQIEIAIDEDEYYLLKIGDKYPVSLVQGFDKKEKLVEQYLEEID